MDPQPPANRCQGSGDCTGPMDPDRRVRITRKTGVASIRPSANFFFGNVFFRRAILNMFSRLQLGAFWASCGSLGASQNPSALCIKSGWAGASVALKIRSEYLKKEALLLLGGPGGPRGALRKPKKLRMDSLAASSGRRTDSLHIHSGSWPPGPQTLSFFCRVSGRVRITRKYAVVSAWALIGPPTDLAWGLFFGEGRLGTFFWGVD